MNRKQSLCANSVEYTWIWHSHDGLPTELKRGWWLQCFSYQKGSSDGASAHIRIWRVGREVTCGSTGEIHHCMLMDKDNSIRIQER